MTKTEKFEIGDNVYCSGDGYPYEVIDGIHPNYMVRKIGTSQYTWKSIYTLLSEDEYFNQKDLSDPYRSSAQADVLPDIPKCTCSSRDLFNFGCKCGGS